MVNDIAVQDFVNAIKEEPTDTNTTYNATVSRVDKEGVVWVNIHGSGKETPTASTSSEVKPGDEVNVNWRNNKLYINGNYTNPSAGFSTVQPSIDFISELVDKDITVNSINAATGYIGELEAKNIKAEDITADHAMIKELDVESMAAAVAYIGDLTAENITADDIIADHATIDTLDSTYATIAELHSDYAEIDLANVNNAWIENGVVKDAAISDAQIIGVSANKLTAGTIDASNIHVTNLNADNITAGSISVDGITIDIENNEATIDGEYIEDGTITMNGLAQSVQNAIDGAIETHTGTVVPTLNNAPASSWTTTKLKDSHVGDIYYVINAGHEADGYCYRFAKSGSTYSWVLIQDSDVTAALSRLTTAEGKIEGLETFESETSSWITETDEELSSVKTNVTSLSGRMDTAEGNIQQKVDTSTFNTLSQTVGENSSNITTLTTITENNGLTTSTNITNTVNNVSQTASGNSSKISQLTTTLGTNADGTTKAGDIIHRTSAVEQDLSGFHTTVEETYATKASVNGKADASAVYTKSEIDQTVSGINASVSAKADGAATTAALALKANKDTLTSEINASADTVKISADKVNITGTTIFNAVNSDASAKSAMLNSEIEIGGRNLLLKTDTPKSWTITLNSSNYQTTDCYQTYSPVPSIFAVDDLVTISFDWSTTGTSGNFHLECGKVTPYAWGTVVNAIGTRSATSNYVDITSSNTSGHAVITFKITNSQASAATTLEWFRIRVDGADMASKTFTVSNAKAERGNKATDWTPAPEDVQAEINAKKSSWNLMSGVTGTSYATILGYSESAITYTIDNTASGFDKTTDVKVGDTVRLKYKATDMGDNGTYVYIVGVATAVPPTTAENKITLAGKGLDTTVIDGGHILTGTIDANSVNISNLTVGAFTGTEQNKVLNSNIEIGGRNLLLNSDTEYTKDLSTSGTILKIGDLSDYGKSVLGVTGTDVVISYEACASVSGLKVGGRYVRNSSGTAVTTATDTTGANTLTTSYKTYTAYCSINASGAATVYVYTGDNTATSGTIWVKNFKVEVGNKATDWTPAPEDTANENLLIDSQKMDAWELGASAQRDVTDEFGVITLNGTTSDWSANCSARPTIRASILDGTPLWLSFEYKASVATALHRVLAGCTNAEGSPTRGTRSKYSRVSSTLAAASSWTRVAFNMPSTVAELTMQDSGAPDAINSLVVQLYNRTNDSVLQIRKVKLEHGFSATDWTPSPEEQKTYITRISDAGIRIHPSSTTNDSVLIDSTGMEIYKGGTSVAKYGDTARIGKVANSQSRVEIGASSIDFINRTSGGTDKTVSVKTMVDGSNTVSTIGTTNVGVRLNDTGSPTTSSITLQTNSTSTANMIYASMGFGEFYIYDLSLGQKAFAVTPSGVSCVALGTSGQVSCAEFYCTGNAYLTKNAGILYGRDASSNNRDMLHIDTSNNLVLGYGNYTANQNTYVEGNKVILRSKNGSFLNDATGTAITSDRRVKRDIKPISDDAVSMFMDLEPVQYKAEKDTTNKTHLGFIAQDVEKALQKNGIEPKTYSIVDEFTTTDTEERVALKCLRYDEFIPLCVKMIQKQQKEIEELKEALNEVLGN